MAAWQGDVPPTGEAFIRGGMKEKRALKQTKGTGVDNWVRSWSHFSCIRKRRALQRIHARHGNQIRCQKNSRADGRAAVIQIL